MTRNVRKFTFDTFFDFDRQPEPAAQAEIEGPPPVYSEADLAQARAEAFEEGRTKALLDHEGTDAHRLSGALERLADGIATMGEAEQARACEFRAAAMNVAITALRKVLPELTRRFGQQEIEAVMADALGEQIEEPKLVIRVPDAAFDPIAECVSDLARGRGYAGKTVVLADNTLGPSDCRIEWADGGVERLAERTVADIAGAIMRLSQMPNRNLSNAISPTE